MTRIYNSIDIQKPIDQVFNFVTTPENWPRWHPSSLKVTGATDRSLDVGEQVTEDYVVAGRRGRVVWMVRERLVPRRWLIQAETEDGGGGTVAYTLTPKDGGTFFEREFDYRTPGWLFRLLDGVAVRRRIERESEQALHNLKRVLETGG
jgi:uncharacterized protein YndB with AHSA1/START domain